MASLWGHHDEDEDYDSILIYEDAEDNYKKSIATGNITTDSHNNLGILYYDQANYTEAIDEVKMSQALQEFEMSHIIRKGRLGNDHQDTKNALEWIKKCNNLLGHFADVQVIACFTTSFGRVKV